MRWVVAALAAAGLVRLARAREVELRTADGGCLVLAPWSADAAELRRLAEAAA